MALRMNRGGSWLTAVLILLWVAGAAAQSEGRIRGTNRHYRHGDWTTWSSMRHIRHLCLSQERLYLATTGGIGCFNFFSQQWEEPHTVSSGLASADIGLVAWDENSGFLWCTQSEGISYLGPASGVWTNLFYDEIGFYDRESVSSIGFGVNHQIFLVTSRGRSLAGHSNGGGFEWGATPRPEEEVKWFGEAAAVDPPPPHLFLPPGYYYDEQERVITDSHGRRYPLTCWLRDAWNTLWIGTWGLGAARVDLVSARFEALPYGLWDDAVDVLAFDQGALWAGGDQGQTGGGGLTRWEIGIRNPEYYEPRYITGFSDDRITAMAFDEEAFWFGTRNGLTRYDLDRRSWRTLSQVDHLSDPRITHLYLDEEYLWVASEAGLSRILKASAGRRDSLVVDIIDPRQLGDLRISFLAPQGDTLWVGTEYGLYWYNVSADSGEFYGDGFFPANQEIDAVVCYGDEVWFGTSYGIAGFNARNGEWFAPPAQRLERLGRIFWMEVDGFSVWAAGERGVQRYDREGLRWIRYSMEDGLPAQEIRTLRIDGDYVWFGSSRGLTLFYWNAPYRID